MIIDIVKVPSLDELSETRVTCKSPSMNHYRPHVVLKAYIIVCCTSRAPPILCVPLCFCPAPAGEEDQVRGRAEVVSASPPMSPNTTTSPSAGSPPPHAQVGPASFFPGSIGYRSLTGLRQQGAVEGCNCMYYMRTHNGPS